MGSSLPGRHVTTCRRDDLRMPARLRLLCCDLLGVPGLVDDGVEPQVVAHASGSELLRGQSVAAATQQPRAVGVVVSEDTLTGDAAERRRLRRLWARLIRRVYEVDPLLCHECGGSMRISSRAPLCVASSSTSTPTASSPSLSLVRPPPSDDAHRGAAEGVHSSGSISCTFGKPWLGAAAPWAILSRWWRVSARGAEPPFTEGRTCPALHPGTADSLRSPLAACRSRLNPAELY